MALYVGGLCIGHIMHAPTNPHREGRRWRASEAIPLEHTDIRPATEAEADLIRRILTADAGGRMPALSLGERLGKLMEGKVNDDE
jgi:hypothetical protein